MGEHQISILQPNKSPKLSNEELGSTHEMWARGRCGRNGDDECVGVVEEAVSFNFGDDYGNRHLFLDLQKEFLPFGYCGTSDHDSHHWLWKDIISSQFS